MGNALKRQFQHIPIATVNGANLGNWRDMAALWYYSTVDLADLARGGVDSDAFLRLLEEKHDFVELSKGLKTLLMEWRQLNDAPWGKILLWVAFHRGSLLQPVLPAIEEYALHRGEMAFMVVHHYLSFLYKAPCNNPKLNTEALLAYYKTEENMPSSFDSQALSDLKEVLSEWCSGAKASGLPNFGPGSTADAGADLGKKEEYLATDELLRNSLPELSWMFTDHDVDLSQRCSKTIFVPKTSLSRRTISMEPAYLSFWQTCVESMLKDILKRSCSHCCDLTKQSKSRQLALTASRTQEFATLDISAASDSISLALVEQAFPWEIVRRLIAVRSFYTSLPTKPEPLIIPLKKYAPMGSRITFPLETLLFCAICEVAVRRTEKVLMAAPWPKYWVYGDDIIIRVEYVSEVINLLHIFGFSLSDQKCFRKGYFYEACGIFALNGVDVTTPCIPRNWKGLPQVGKPTQPDRIVEGIGLCNRFLVAGMTRARKYVLERLPVRFLPFTEFQTSFIADDKPDDYDKTFWSSHGIWTLGPASNDHLEFRKVAVYQQPEPPSRCALDQSSGVLLLPGPCPRKAVRPAYGLYEYKILQTRIESYDSKYSDEVRYKWKLRHPEIQPGATVEIPSPPVGFGPRMRLRKGFTQL